MNTNKNKKVMYIVIISLIVLSVFSFFKAKGKESFGFNNNIIKEKSNNKYYENEKLCLDFVMKSMTSKNGGIYTNYLDNKKILETASGHEILSESEGLIMLYFIKTNNKKQFDKHIEILKKDFLVDDGVFRWRIKEGYSDTVNTSASIDDLRIMRALIYGYTKWKDQRYYELFIKINSGLLNNNVYKNMITNFYDFHNKAVDKNINLCYIDLYTMELCSKSGKNKWIDIKKQGLKIINNGYISKSLPLYKKVYNIEKNKYDNFETVNLIDSLLVVLHLSEIGKQKSETIKWIKTQLNEGAIYSEYNIKTGKKVTNEQSTAVYALAARIGKVIKDNDLYNMAVNKMINFQVSDKNSKIYGSFGNELNLQVFSFDNLQALLGF